MKQETVGFHVRLPKHLHRKLCRAAHANHVSLNREIINQLEGRSPHNSVPDSVRSIIESTAIATAEMLIMTAQASQKEPMSCPTP